MHARISLTSQDTSEKKALLPPIADEETGARTGAVTGLKVIQQYGTNPGSNPGRLNYKHKNGIFKITCFQDVLGTRD